MQQVFFPGHAGQPCLGEYAIALDRSETFSRADIVLVSRAAHGGDSFWSSDLGRETVLNRILASDLEGIRLDGSGCLSLSRKPPLLPVGCLNFSVSS